MRAFLSHASADRAIVIAVHEAIEKDAAWLDRADIEWGDLFLEKISEAISLATDFVLFWSAAAAQSEWVRLEINMAFIRAVRHKAMTLRVVTLDDTPLPLYLQPFHIFSVAGSSSPTADTLGKLSSLLRKPVRSTRPRRINRQAGRARMKAGFDGPKFPQIGVTALEPLEIVNTLRQALENAEFQLRYQKQVDLEGRLAGLEALLVWNHPKLGLIPPSKFIPVAEESGLIVPIGTWALREACRQSAQWQGGRGRKVGVAVNVSAVQFRAGFVETVDEVLQGTGLDPSVLELELTESCVMRDSQESARLIDRLKSLGVRLAIDDFGTGYSSLSSLRMLRIDTLKIDRSFLEGIESEPNAMPLLKAIVVLAHSLKLCVIAEGVETEHQLEALRAVCCDRVQGPLIGEPVPAEAVSGLLA